MQPTTSASYKVSVELKAYPADHPIWQDINFTPEDVYSKVEAVRRKQGAPKGTADLASGSPWSPDEDALLCYLHTPAATQHGLTLDTVAPLMRRTPAACRSRWAALVAQQGSAWLSSSFCADLAARGRARLLQLGAAAGPAGGGTMRPAAAP